MPSLVECSICIMFPGPALVARSLAALELVHVNDTQVAGTTESGKICDSDDCAAGSDESLVHKGFVAPGGAVVRITNLSAFCRACNLSVVHMHQLKSGKRPSHKGWTWKHDADRAFH